jgi:hypothetical protein
VFALGPPRCQPCAVSSQPWSGSALMCTCPAPAPAHTCCAHGESHPRTLSPHVGLPRRRVVSLLEEAPPSPPPPHPPLPLARRSLFFAHRLYWFLMSFGAGVAYASELCGAVTQDGLLNKSTLMTAVVIQGAVAGASRPGSCRPCVASSHPDLRASWKALRAW